MTPQISFHKATIAILRIFKNRLDFWAIVFTAILCRGFLAKKAKTFTKEHSRIAVNHTGYSIGHLTIELEWAYAILNSNIDVSKIYFAFHPNAILDEFTRLYSDRDPRLVFVQSRWKYICYQAIALSNPGLSLDIGVSSKKLHSPDFSGRAEFGALYYRHELCHRFLEKYQPIKSAFEVVSDLEVPVEIKKMATEPYVVLQIKNTVANGTAVISDHSKLKKLVQEIVKSGRKIVLCGREILPASLSGLGVIEYSTMKVASVKNDFWLVANSDFVICSASGFNFLPYVLNKPTLIYGVSSFSYPSHPYFIILPQLMRDGFGAFLSYKKQLNTFIIWGQQDGNKTRSPEFEIFEPSESDYLDAFFELAGKRKSNIELQNRFNMEMSRDTGYYSQSRVASRILETNRDLL